MNKKEEIAEKINRIGRELYELNHQVETYTVVFDGLVAYYQENHKIV